MKTSIRILSATSLLFASLGAHAVDDTYLFGSISSVEHTSNATGITGVLVNDSVPTSITAPAIEGIVGSRCAKYYDAMLKKQGVYTLALTVRTETYTGPGGFPTTRVELLKCSLTRNP